MATFTFGDDSPILNRSNFIELGSSIEGLSDKLIQEVESKINNQNDTKPSAIWATLGWEDDGIFSPEGLVSFSERGTTEHAKVSREQVAAIMQFNPLSSNTTPKTVTD